jgi:hypothetical protein
VLICFNLSFVDEILAVSVWNTEMNYETGKTYQSKNAIQLWNMGRLHSGAVNTKQRNNKIKSFNTFK